MFQPLSGSTQFDYAEAGNQVFFLRQIQILFVRKGGCLDYQIVVPELLQSW